MKSISILAVVIGVLVITIANIASADTFGTGANEFTIDFVNISGDASSANGTNISKLDFGDNKYKAFYDPSSFRIGTHETTNDQWNKFRANYGPVTGSTWNAYENSPFWTGADIPTNNVSWLEAAQFVNWLNTSTSHAAAYKFTGTQGQSDYTFAEWDVTDSGYNSSNPYRNSNAHYFLPSEDEWIKAAYWNGTSLQKYSNASVDDLISGLPDSAKWNYNASAGSEPWAVGSGAQELNGTYDMIGNIQELLDSPYYNDNLLPSRVLRGGGYNNAFFGLLNRGNSSLPYESNTIGFRVASVPEPTTLLLLGLGAVMVRRKK